MGRVLRRVPLEFSYPIGKVWYGYFVDNLNFCKGDANIGMCAGCIQMAKQKGIPFTEHGCPDYEAYTEDIQKQLRERFAPPEGEGYQVWDTTSEGTPLSPVFVSLEDLCEWCEKNVTYSPGHYLSKEEWKAHFLAQKSCDY